MVYRYNFTIIILFFILIITCKKNIDYPYDSYRSPHTKQEIYNLLNNNHIPENIKINKLPQNIYPISGTVSHHLLVSSIIDKWFSYLKSKRKIKTFIIISPDHFRTGNNNISLSTLDWNIGDNKIKTNKKYAKKILKHMNLKGDRAMFHNEHGISSVLPFIKKYYPNAKIVPIAMDEFNKQINQCYRLSEVIYDIMKNDKDAFLLISVDFSHKGGTELTQKRDKITKQVLYSLDKNKVNLAYSDNNVGLITLFSVCEKLKIRNTHILCHTDAEEFIDKGLKDDITSYFFTFQY